MIRFQVVKMVEIFDNDNNWLDSYYQDLGERFKHPESVVNYVLSVIPPSDIWQIFIDIYDEFGERLADISMINFEDFESEERMSNEAND